jgi:hypothetical protein
MLKLWYSLKIKGILLLRPIYKVYLNKARTIF